MLRHGDKKLPIFVSFWDQEADSSWSGVFHVCSMSDEAAERQTCLFDEMVVNVLCYPCGRATFVLSDNTASVSEGVSGSMALLQRKLRGKNTREKLPIERGGSSSGGGRGREKGEVKGGSTGRRGRGGAVRGRDRRRGRGEAQCERTGRAIGGKKILRRNKQRRLRHHGRKACGTASEACSVATAGAYTAAGSGTRKGGREVEGVAV